ncbi:MAG: 50S ribosomal protein L4 [Chloroflexi bacterium]|jgi:large subunit ribosomal protein L4|nr:MAG: 50S ribosomal protein L4 [Chloroflexi bacterium OLB13]MBC6956319.1 50S ribosomal protein L4 [Chloroflexota bacterium]MBV6434876.1 50S ribosomal protein L4 [Anaerolineae bacterium]MDL1916316.1 50S ribosomal protein L4 [Anaerolineae bacterium CFX4]OQY83865.1 MAG: 50S ribosomal protein L4 [Anaerolineae bacterium UTCFX5]
MQFPVKDVNGKQVSTVDLPAEIFGISREDLNVGLMHQAYVRQMANARLGTHKTKTRGEVSISTAKIYRQKGTGRARHGSRNAPIFVGGGKAHGPIPHKYTKDMPKKMVRAALRNALSAAVLDEQLVVVDKLSVSAPKTKEVSKVLDALVGSSSALVLLAERNENLERGIGNLDRAFYLRASYLNVRDLLTYDKVIVPLDALEVLTSWLGTEG